MGRTERKWLYEQMSPYFFQGMSDEPEALAMLERELDALRTNRRLILADRGRRQILACVDESGSLVESLRRIDSRSLSYAMFSHSRSAMPGMEQGLEVQRFDFERRPDHELDLQRPVVIPSGLRRAVLRELAAISPDLPQKTADSLLRILWLNAEQQIRLAPPARVAWLIWLLEQGGRSGGMFLDLQQVVHTGVSETRVLVSIGNPTQDEVLLQLAEVFNRLGIGIRRAYCLMISNGVHPYFLGTFFVSRRDGGVMDDCDRLCLELKQELCNTQILDTEGYAYREWVLDGTLSADDAVLANVFVEFCHTSLAHNQPDRFGLDDVQGAFYAHPEMTAQLIRLFRARFDPAVAHLPDQYEGVLKETVELVDEYNTGHRWLDEIRQTVYRCCLLFVSHCLKTNFFVVEKQAIAFRLDPQYLKSLGAEFTSDLPESLPFRVTFFYSRFGCGYHVGFSDIARGGWRTVIARNQDDRVTQANSLFREVYVLAHTQHLKNKDIYEGGSKMVLVMDASDLEQSDQNRLTNRLYKLQYSIINAFLDIFVTDNGVVRNPRVVDYYRDDEPIELGPDENMHDSMVEAIASLSAKRGYLLGPGIISSKRFGINHKEYGVTSTGVMTFVEVVMSEQGIQIGSDPFSVKMTGGPGGDVAGNCLHIMLSGCPQVQIKLVLDGTAAAYDPAGLDHAELKRLALHHDLDQFDPQFLSEGGFLLYRSQRTTERMRELYRRVERLSDGTLADTWVTQDDFFREYDSLVFKVRTDLFIPAGGRPETIAGYNWQQFMADDGTPSSRLIVEGANSFITPDARLQLQKAGVVLMRDASANKCGVISSSYEIIANLLLTEQEFMACKEQYVADLLEILRKRAGDEARLILRRWKEADGGLSYTAISDQISQNINSFYHRIFSYFLERPELCAKRPYRDALIRHMPRILAETPRFRRRITRLPAKYLAAILAAEIGASLVYSSNRDMDFEEMIRRHLLRLAS